MYSDQQVLDAYKANQYNQRATARALGMARTTLQDRLAKIGERPEGVTDMPQIMVMKDRVRRLEEELREFQREALDALYALGNDGSTCYEPRGGIRCVKTWDHPTLPVTEGRTLFSRDGDVVGRARRPPPGVRGQ